MITFEATIYTKNSMFDESKVALTFSKLSNKSYKINVENDCLTEDELIIALREIIDLLNGNGM